MCEAILGIPEIDNNDVETNDAMARMTFQI